jgi:hypothetical protein
LWKQTIWPTLRWSSQWLLRSIPHHRLMSSLVYADYRSLSLKHDWR